MKQLSVFVLACACLVGPVHAATINASSCSQSNVQSAISSASPGDTVRVPAGNCSWAGGLTISGISLEGAGSSSAGTVITGGRVSIRKHSNQITQLAGFRFSGSDQHFDVGGSASARPFIIAYNFFRADASPKLGTITVNGGLIHNNVFTASRATSADVLNIITSEDWRQSPTFGNQDTSGERNIYFEDNTFTGILETMPDGDAGSRLVIRHNRYVDSSIVFHGGFPTDSSPQGGTRQFEVYNNVFDRQSNSVAINKWIWVRGSTGVIANNTMARADSPDGSSYPNKREILLTVGCPDPYPVQYQVGQSSESSENPPSHPLAIFGNTGAGTNDGNFIAIAGSDTAGPSCSSASNYIREGRDYVRSNAWGWTPYAYPHPLQAFSGGGGGLTPPEPPTDLTSIVQ